MISLVIEIFLFLLQTFKLMKMEGYPEALKEPSPEEGFGKFFFVFMKMALVEFGVKSLFDKLIGRLPPEEQVDYIVTINGRGELLFGPALLAFVDWAMLSMGSPTIWKRSKVGQQSELTCYPGNDAGLKFVELMEKYMKSEMDGDGNKTFPWIVALRDSYLMHRSEEAQRVGDKRDASTRVQDELNEMAMSVAKKRSVDASSARRSDAAADASPARSSAAAAASSARRSGGAAASSPARSSASNGASSVRRNDAAGASPQRNSAAASTPTPPRETRRSGAGPSTGARSAPTTAQAGAAARAALNTLEREGGASLASESDRSVGNSSDED